MSPAALFASWLHYDCIATASSVTHGIITASSLHHSCISVMDLEALDGNNVARPSTFTNHALHRRRSGQWLDWGGTLRGYSWGQSGDCKRSWDDGIGIGSGWKWPMRGHDVVMIEPLELDKLKRWSACTAKMTSIRLDQRTT